LLTLLISIAPDYKSYNPELVVEETAANSKSKKK